jgi:hypothetical protein
MSLAFDKGIHCHFLITFDGAVEAFDDRNYQWIKIRGRITYA